MKNWACHRAYDPDSGGEWPTRSGSLQGAYRGALAHSRYMAVRAIDRWPCRQTSSVLAREMSVGSG